jgi:acyl dehydratase
MHPIHIDLAMTHTAGFGKPLRGLCTPGYVTRIIQQRYKESVVRKVKARFSTVVVPGQTLGIQFGEIEVLHFEAKVLETCETCVRDAWGRVGFYAIVSACSRSGVIFIEVVKRRQT